MTYLSSTESNNEFIPNISETSDKISHNEKHPEDKLQHESKLIAEDKSLQFPPVMELMKKCNNIQNETCSTEVLPMQKQTLQRKNMTFLF